jgi:helix-turn-helix protein
MVTPARKKLLTPEEVSEYIRKPLHTLANWRNQNFGPPYTKVGHNVRYYEDGLLKFLEANRVDPTEAG